MEPLTEWCIVGTSLCGKSEIWAAWVQGVGSVLAIVAAIAIADRQQKLARRTKREDDEEARYRASEACRFFGKEILACLVDLHDCTIATRAACEADALRSVIDLTKGLDISRLSGEVTAPYLNLWRAAHHAERIARYGTVGSPEWRFELDSLHSYATSDYVRLTIIAIQDIDENHPRAANDFDSGHRLAALTHMSLAGKLGEPRAEAVTRIERAVIKLGDTPESSRTAFKSMLSQFLG